MRTRNGRKRPLLTSGTAAFARRFCSEVYSLPRIGWESSSHPSHRGYLLPGWQTGAFASAIPNASRRWNHVWRKTASLIFVEPRWHCVSKPASSGRTRFTEIDRFGARALTGAQPFPELLAW